MGALDIEQHLALLGEECGNLALQCSDVTGFVNQVNQRIEAEHKRLAELKQNVRQLASLQQEAMFASSEIRHVAGKTAAVIGESHDAVLSSIDEIAKLIDDFVTIGSELEEFATAIEQVGSISENLQTIARHTGMLAINASIEAARAGEGSAGFAAVASEVKRLSKNASNATATVTESIGSLQERARRVIGDLRAGAERGRAARMRTREITSALESIAALVTQFDQSTAEIERCGELVTGHVGTIGSGLESITDVASQNGMQLIAARERLDDLEAASNLMLDRVGHSGVRMRDSRFVDLALQGANEVTRTITTALQRGDLARADLFDRDYKPVPRTDPEQYLTRLVPFADRTLRPLFDRQVSRDGAIVGCVIVDRNGYLPTHVSEKCQQQRPGDRIWNLEHARNRQMFLDRQTRDAMARDGDWFLFTYRQDFGDGRYRALRSVFVPLEFDGERWGLYELGYLI